MQLNLPLADLPSDADSLWEQLDPTARDALVDALAQAIAKETVPVIIGRQFVCADNSNRFLTPFVPDPPRDDVE
jgi:hypothetical protein